MVKELYLVYPCSLLLLQSEDRAKAVQNWSKIHHSMTVLGISEGEMSAMYSVLAAIYHLGAAGTVKGRSYSRNSRHSFFLVLF